MRAVRTQKPARLLALDGFKVCPLPAAPGEQAGSSASA
jgi:hypothetical protein